MQGYDNQYVHWLQSGAVNQCSGKYKDLCLTKHNINLQV